MPTTSVRRRISLFSRSSELLLQSCRQCSFGKPVKASGSGPVSSSSAAASGKRVASWATIRACCSCTDSASGWAKIERTIVATNDCALFGTRVSRLRMKYVPPFAEEYRRRAVALLRESGLEAVDPMRRDFRGNTAGREAEIVEGDLEEIRSCDAVLPAFTAP